MAKYELSKTDASDRKSCWISHSVWQGLEKAISPMGDPQCNVVEKYGEGTKGILGTTNQAGVHVYILSSDLDHPILLCIFNICSAASVTL